MKEYIRKLKEYKDFLYPLFILGLLLVLFKGFFLPKAGEIIFLREERKRMENKVNELTSYLSYLQNLKFSSLPIEEEIVNYALPSEKNIISVIVAFEGLGKIEGVSLEPFSLKPGIISQGKRKGKEKQAPSKVQEIVFEMRAKAEDEQAAKKLLEKILVSRRTLAIKSLKWSLDREGKINLNLSLLAYYLPNFTVDVSQKLVKEGDSRRAFLEKLKQTESYEEKISETTAAGKEDLFSL